MIFLLNKSERSVKGLAALSIAAALLVLLRKTSAATRHLIWFSAMAGVVLLPVLSTSLPGWNVLRAWLDVNPSEAPQPLATTGVPADTQPTGDSTASIEPMRLPKPVETVDHDQENRQGQRPEPFTVDPATSAVDAVADVDIAQAETPDTSTATFPDHPERAASATSIAAETPAEPSNLAANWIFRIWLAGCTLALLRLLLEYLSLWRLARNSQTLTDTQVNQFAASLSADLGLRRPVQLLEIPLRTVPMTWGLLRPKILLPEARADWPEERLRVVLLHELGHVKRID